MPPPNEGAPALRLEDVRRSFRVGKRVVKAIDGITASAAQGAVTGLIGPDGAGKTTLMRLIAGLLRADAGKIEALGIDVARKDNGNPGENGNSVWKLPPGGSQLPPGAKHGLEAAFHILRGGGPGGHADTHRRPPLPGSGAAPASTVLLDAIDDAQRGSSIAKGDQHLIEYDVIENLAPGGPQAAR